MSADIKEILLGHGIDLDAFDVRAFVEGSYPGLSDAMWQLACMSAPDETHHAVFRDQALYLGLSHEDLDPVWRMRVHTRAFIAGAAVGSAPDLEDLTDDMGLVFDALAKELGLLWCSKDDLHPWNSDYILIGKNRSHKWIWLPVPLIDKRQGAALIR